MPKGNPGGYNIFGDASSGVKSKGKKVMKKGKGKMPFKPFVKKAAAKKKVVAKKKK